MIYIFEIIKKYGFLNNMLISLLHKLKYRKIWLKVTYYIKKKQKHSIYIAFI